MRMFITIVVILLIGTLVACPKSSSLPASAPKLMVNGQALAPIAWDTPSQSVRVRDPFAGEGEQEPTEDKLSRDISKWPAHLWREGAHLEIAYDKSSWDLTKHGLYLIVARTPEEIKQAEQLLSQNQEGSSDGSAKLPHPRSSRRGDLMVLTKFGELIPPQKVDSGAGLLKYNWDKVDAILSVSLGVGIVITPYPDGAYLICQLSSEPSDAEQKAAQDAIKKERKRLGYTD